MNQFNGVRKLSRAATGLRAVSAVGWQQAAITARAANLLD
jgi:hypothetical protein